MEVTVVFSPKDGVRAIRRRLSTAGKNYTSVMYTLTVSHSSSHKHSYSHSPLSSGYKHRASHSQ